MRTALDVLRGGRAATSSQRQAGHIEARPMKLAQQETRDSVSKSSDEVDVVRISQRNSIPISENYVLVMEGLSTYSFEHPRGTSFVVDNSRYNRDRDQHYREAMTAAVALARARRLTKIYVLN